MITQPALDFLAALRVNNNREWFEAHRALYQQAAADFFDTVARFIQALASYDPDIAKVMPDPKSCIMRIYRDVRFSKDKTPYKTGLFAYISVGGRKGPLAGYYLHLEPGNSFGGGGLYLPEAPVLAQTRQAIDSRFDEWRSIVTAPELLAAFPDGVLPSGALKRAPKEYDESNPAIHYLRYKGYYTQRFFSDGEVLSRDFTDRLGECCRAVMPMVAFLNSAIASEKP
ncbi:DUF2461 domain-containing protein [Chlorobaculum thiosulfatiphilum]|jgi:uncharacterized protein (TIGR02453 family)|uniref:DUF2461 domain-containing protein n=1 Tax=Chlorobaculum thiosulfatiphilum TaxID=115852 RepID=A0A5C4S115_CHLTI|nr:DUF2461 domain-containing protein [Chlorobaculum thiosulfatiphilum]TNJ37170.1 DUF2461 domain-containing protein [Chlorobaculum thiosulfatiphilum]